MAIRSFRDFAQTKSYGEVQMLPKGGYVMRILGATVEENSIGQYVKIQMDIAEGEYRDFYRRDYENQQTEDNVRSIKNCRIRITSDMEGTPRRRSVIKEIGLRYVKGTDWLIHTVLFVSRRESW